MTEVQKVLDRYGTLLLKVVKQRIIEGNKIASGRLINSLQYKYSRSNGQYRIQITGAPYLINVDRGRAAGRKQPPVKAIEAWLKVKQIKIGNGLKPLIARGKKAPPEKEIKRAAFAIARSIGKRGIKPFPILNVGKAIIRTPQFKSDLLKAIIIDMKSLTKY